MSTAIRITGQNAIGRKIALALAERAIPAWGSTRLVILGDWPDTLGLYGLAEHPSLPILLLEDAGDGATAVGPIFTSSSAGCIRCYIARRRANGGQECRPASALTERALDQITWEVGAFLDGQSTLQREQVEVPPTGPILRHMFLPVPTCPSCWQRPIERQGLDIESLVSPRLGLVHAVRSIAGTPNGMAANKAVGCRTDAFAPVQALNHGMAVDDAETRARHRAIAESVERYCAALAPQNLPQAVATELGGGYIDPYRFSACDAPRNGATRVRWVKACLLTSGREVWVAAALVYVPYEPGSEDLVVGLQTSVGLAAGTSLDIAIQRGLAEIIERDVCLRAWRHCVPVERIPIEPYQIPGLHLSLVPNDSGLNVVVAFLEQVRLLPLTSTGLAARPALADATRHATREAVLSRLWLTEWLAQHPHCVSMAPRTMIENAVAHAVCPSLALSRWHWLHPSRVEKIYEHPTAWDDVVRMNPEACYIDITTPDVEMVGIKVVRVLVPGRILTDDDALQPRIGGNAVPHPFG